MSMFILMVLIIIIVIVVNLKLDTINYEEQKAPQSIAVKLTGI